LFVCASKSTQRAHEEMTGEGFFYMVLSAWQQLQQQGL
jgi:hypothetical protein